MQLARVIQVFALLALVLLPGCAADQRENFLLIVTKADNIPIVMMMPLFAFFSWLSWNQGRKNDKLIDQGKRDEVLKRMQD